MGTTEMYIVYIDGKPRSMISAESQELAMAGAQKAHNARGLISLVSAFEAPLDDVIRIVALGFIEVSSVLVAFTQKVEATMAAADMRSRLGGRH